MIASADFQRIIIRLGDTAVEDISWSESVTTPSNADDFALEAIFVICNSGMRYTVASKIFEKVRDQIVWRMPAAAVFGHEGKVRAIEAIWADRHKLYAEYLAAEDKLAFCASLPWIGEITKYHLAKNYGADVAKPDVHLKRLADREGTTAQALCERLAAETGYRVATVDVVLWRACATGIIDSKSGSMTL